MMTRKDYRALASALANAHLTCVTEGEHEVLTNATTFIADVLALDNPNFKRETFVLATLRVEVRN